jgi:DNA polymerase III subunit beta
MRATIQRKGLLEAIEIGERIAGKRESLPILNTLLIKAGKKVEVHATNLEAAFMTELYAEVSEEGAVAVPATILSQTIRALEGEKITLSTDGGNLILESRGSRTLIHSLSHTDFPSFPSIPSKQKILIPKEQLLTGLQSVSYAASPSMIRQELGSVFIHLKGDSLTLAATDSFRLAEKILPIKNIETIELLLPLRHVQELLHILSRVTRETASLSLDEAHVVFDFGDIFFISRVVEGNFPNYRELIPKSATTTATLLKSDFSNLLKKARVFSGEDQSVGLHIYPSKKIMSATARSASVGEMSDMVDAALEGNDLDINFHIHYLSDCLSAISSDSVTLQFSGAGRPLIIRGTGDASFTYLVMPLNR